MAGNRGKTNRKDVGPLGGEVEPSGNFIDEKPAGLAFVTIEQQLDLAPSQNETYQLERGVRYLYRPHHNFTGQVGGIALN
jgi:hypothetical protein